jgi:hypothetical protein
MPNWVIPVLALIVLVGFIGFANAAGSSTPVLPLSHA